MDANQELEGIPNRGGIRIIKVGDGFGIYLDETIVPGVRLESISTAESSLLSRGQALWPSGRAFDLMIFWRRLERGLKSEKVTAKLREIRKRGSLTLDSYVVELGVEHGLPSLVRGVEAWRESCRKVYYLDPSSVPPTVQKVLASEMLSEGEKAHLLWHCRKEIRFYSRKPRERLWGPIVMPVTEDDSQAMRGFIELWEGEREARFARRLKVAVVITFVLLGAILARYGCATQAGATPPLLLRSLVAGSR